MITQGYTVQTTAKSSGSNGIQADIRLSVESLARSATPTISTTNSDPIVNSGEQEEDESPLLRSSDVSRVINGTINAYKARWYANPQYAIMIGWLEIAAMFYFLRTFHVVEGSFFRFGPPIQLFQYKVESPTEFYGVLAVFFIHQMVYTWLNEVVHPWILTEVQSTQCRQITFSKPKTVALINLYYAYYTLNNVIAINLSVAQISFLLAILAGDLIGTTVINVHYIWNKDIKSDSLEVELHVL